jgi:hypothetical protein
MRKPGLPEAKPAIADLRFDHGIDIRPDRFSLEVVDGGGVRAGTSLATRLAAVG